MANALTGEQIQRVVDNTVLVLLVRPDLMEEWQSNLMTLLEQAQQADLEEEAIFIAAVLTLLHYPDDSLLTGTRYDHAWEHLQVGLQTGSSHAVDQSESMTLDHLLGSIVEAIVTIKKQAPAQQNTVRGELQGELKQIKAAAVEAKVGELVAWLDDAAAVLEGESVHNIQHGHQGVYASYWQVLAQNLDD
jgi:hypothetical protein